MIKNYFKTAWRNLAKRKLFSLVNILGLSLGIAGSILIGLYLLNEFGYDHFHKNAGRLVRATTEYTVNGEKNEVGNTGSMAGPRLTAAFPQIESFVRMLNFEPYAVRYGDRNFVEKRFLFADSVFFTMFTFPMLEGDPRTALDGPGKVVITKSMATKYFGEEPAMGKTLLVGGTRNYIVSGVAEDAPANSQIKFDFVASYASLPNANNPNWGVEVYATYFLLRPGTDPVSLEKNIGVFMRKLPELVDLGSDYLIYHLEPITRVHLYSRLSGLEPNGNIQYIYILAIIAILILIIAGVNYTNLTTAQAVGRIPEISIRKVLGSRRIQLFWQFMGESLLLNLMAMAIAIILVLALLPAFDQLVERPIQAGMILQPAGISLLLVLYAGMSFMAGIYPALVLSGLKLIRILKAGFSFSTGTGPLRKSLIVFQFFASIFLIISTVVIYEQMQYIRKKDLGYDQSHVVVLPVDLAMRPNFRAIKESMARLPGVLSVSCGAEEPTYIRWDDAVTLSPGPSSKPVLTYASPADPDFVRTLGLHIIAGTDFTQADWMKMNGPDNPDPQTSFMLNETLTRAMGWNPQDALGKIIYRSDHKGVVKAVVKDFNFAPLHTPVAPLVIFLDSQYFHIYQAFVKISGNNIPSTLQSMETTWKERVTHRPFEYHFLDDNFNSIYHTEEQTAQIFTVFSALAIVLACMGLFALAAYTTVQRAKEIGIRKVLGAGEWKLVMLVSGDFLKLVGISMVLAFPVAWYFVHRWLENFAYRIQISWVIFLAVGGAAVALAFVSIFVQAYRAAIANPVRSLRAE